MLEDNNARIQMPRARGIQPNLKEADTSWTKEMVEEFNRWAEQHGVKGADEREVVAMFITSDGFSIARKRTAAGIPSHIMLDTIPTFVIEAFLPALGCSSAYIQPLPVVSGMR